MNCPTPPHLSSRLSSGLGLFSSNTEDSGSFCRRRFPSAPRFRAWAQRGGCCGLGTNTATHEVSTQVGFSALISVRDRDYLPISLSPTQRGDATRCGPSEVALRPPPPPQRTPPAGRRGARAGQREGNEARRCHPRLSPAALPALRAAVRAPLAEGHGARYPRKGGLEAEPGGEGAAGAGS